MEKVTIEYADGTVVDAMFPSKEELDKEWENMQKQVSSLLGPNWIELFQASMMEE